MDEWELENLRSEVSDLESERDELHTLILEARDIIARASNLIDDQPSWDRMAEPWLQRTRHIR